MKIKFKLEIEQKFQEAIEGLREIGLIPERIFSIDSIDISTLGGEKESMLNAKVILTFYLPDSLIEIEKDK